MHDSTSTFPFKSVLNLRQLVEFWETQLQRDFCPGGSSGILNQLQAAPELKLPIKDPAILQKHKSLIDFMMSAVVSPAFANDEMTGAIVPFQFNPFYTTPLFRQALPLDNMSKVSINLPGSMEAAKIIRAGILILNKFYNANITVDKPLLFHVPDEKTGLVKIYNVEINHRFCDIIAKREPRPIDKQVIKFLTEKIFDVDLWLHHINPDDFEFHGFVVMKLVDVTEQEMISSIKYDLLKRNSVTDPKSFDEIQQKLRSIFKIPELRLGIAYFDPNNNLIVNSGLNAWKNLCEHETLQCVDYEDSIYERAWTEKRYITIENLEEYPYRSKIENALLHNGVKSLLIAPMMDEGEVIGMLEIAAPEVGLLNPVSATRVEGALPMFTAAVKRVKEEMETEVRAIIQEECTAIHPSVQWRFFDAGVNLLNKRRAGMQATLEEIVFKDIYPLFGLVDVRNSSVERTLAIQQDLLQNLNMAKDVLQKITDTTRLPLLDELIYRTELQLKQISAGLASGDESNVLEFLKQEVNPMIRHFATDSRLHECIMQYNNNLDPILDVVYKRRKAFEESLSQINKAIGSYIDDAQRHAQRMFPHYFEKYQTDGIEFTLYLGSSLVKDKPFNPFYLKNFRLWQLLVMCDIDLRMEALRPTLKNKLDITQLILVHDQAISIRFRPDEKQFDVDGAYDIRYEIVKKRIDKAYIKNTNERLTQPGKLAIVYNNGRVEEEYRQYFRYLIAKNIIHPEVEELELEELPGATGLKALRVRMVRHHEHTASQNLLKELEAVLHQ